MRRLLLATIAAVVVATPISVAYGSSSSPANAPSAKTTVSDSKSGGASAPKARSGGHGDRDCPLGETTAI